MLRWIKRVSLLVLAVMVAGGLFIVGTLMYQGTRKPVGTPEYVALGSSNAAGIGIGDRAPGSPFACMRGTGGYPRVLARTLGLSLVDMTCSGATAMHVLRGGQYFQGPQLNAVQAKTRLVTLTAGGNDIDYVGDLFAMAKINEGGLVGWAIEHVMGAPQAAKERDYDQVEANMHKIIEVLRERAPSAQIVLVTYPAILPPEGTCESLGLTADQAAMMRPVAARLAALTRSVAKSSGATLVDIAMITKGHDACSAQPWINGNMSKPEDGTAFHPNRLGAAETARNIVQALAADGA